MATALWFGARDVHLGATPTLTLGQGELRPVPVLGRGLVPVPAQPLRVGAVERAEAVALAGGPAVPKVALGPVPVPRAVRRQHRLVSRGQREEALVPRQGL